MPPRTDPLSEGLTPHTIPEDEELTPHIGSSGGWFDLSQALHEQIQKIGKRTPTDTVKKAIRLMCASRPFKPSEIALLLKRNQRYIRDYYLTPMIESGELELVFPDNLAHPQQANREKQS